MAPQLRRQSRNPLTDTRGYTRYGSCRSSDRYFRHRSTSSRQDSYERSSTDRRNLPGRNTNHYGSASSNATKLRPLADSSYGQGLGRRGHRQNTRPVGPDVALERL